MSQDHVNYWNLLNQRTGRSWNRFWFAPSDPLPLCFLRLAVGLLSLAYLFSFNRDLVRLFAADGLMSTETMEAIRGEAAIQGWIYFSVLDWATTPGILWIVHVVSALILILFTLGVFTRTTSVLSLLVVLSYIHRQPVLTGPFEPILSMLLLYLCLGPCGAYLSVDRWRATTQGVAKVGGEGAACWTATVSLRLIQLHCVGFYLLMGLSKLAGQVWWEGAAVWVLISQVRSRPIDLTFLREQRFVLEAWTHAIVAFELVFPVLVWKPLLRPLLSGLALVMWILLALLTGLAGFCLVMLVASAAFLPPKFYQRLAQRFPGADRLLAMV